jgi:hypothetical protein
MGFADWNEDQNDEHPDGGERGATSIRDACGREVLLEPPVGGTFRGAKPPTASGYPLAPVAIEGDWWGRLWVVSITR